MMHTLKKSIPSEVNQLNEVENFIEEISTTFNLLPKLLGRVALSIVEAVGNAILYGNKRDVSKMVTLVVEKRDEQLVVTISDEGEGFDYANISDPTLEENVDKESKRGLFLMKILSNDMIFENNGATVIMRFDL